MALRWLPPGGVCGTMPFCAEFEVEFRGWVHPIEIELQDPDKPGDVWMKVPGGQWSFAGLKEALDALNEAISQQLFVPRYRTPCQKGCTCKLSGKWGEWSAWGRTPLSASFSIKAPKPPPARLHYRVNGSVQTRFRAQIGFCRKK